MDKGIYCLGFQNPACTVTIGALGQVAFAAGWHLYVGSALGSGGLARLCRHIALAREKDRRPRWHVDYLLTNDAFRLRFTVFAVTPERLECRLAEAFRREGGVPGFGCSDCDCLSHLFYRKGDPAQEIRDAFLSLKLAPATKTLKNPYERNGIL